MEDSDKKIMRKMIILVRDVMN